jgi:hypothetical protein
MITSLADPRQDPPLRNGTEVRLEPRHGKRSDAFHRLPVEQTTRTGHNRQLFRAGHPNKRTAIQTEDTVVGLADDQECRRSHPFQRVTRKVGSAFKGNHRLH